MRVLFAKNNVSYWLEPTIMQAHRGRIRLMGCKLYKLDGKFVGWWEASDMPKDTKDMILHQVREAAKRDKALEKVELEWLAKD